MRHCWNGLYASFLMIPPLVSLKKPCVNHLEDAERAAHTLKGVAANLGFQTLSDISAKLMQALRDKDTDLAQTLLTEVREERVRVLGLIAAIG